MINPTIQSILLIGYAAYETMHLLPDFVREAAHCLMVCRTAVLGGHTQACPDGHYQSEYGTIPVSTGCALSALTYRFKNGLPSKRHEFCDAIIFMSYLQYLKSYGFCGISIQD